MRDTTSQLFLICLAVGWAACFAPARLSRAANSITHKMKHSSVSCGACPTLQLDSCLLPVSSRECNMRQQGSQLLPPGVACFRRPHAGQAGQGSHVLGLGQGVCVAAQMCE